MESVHVHGVSAERLPSLAAFSRFPASWWLHQFSETQRGSVRTWGFGLGERLLFTCRVPSVPAPGCLSVVNAGGKVPVKVLLWSGAVNNFCIKTTT